MDRNKKEPEEALTLDDLNEFMSAESYDKQWKILLAHAEKNKKIIKIRRLKKMNNNHELTNQEISRQFEEFCHTKGLVAKFKVAFSDMAENAKRQKAEDRKNFEEVKRKSAEENPEFTEFIHTKGLKAKVKLIIENVKKGAKEMPKKTAADIDKLSAEIKENIAKNQPNIARHGVNKKDISEYSPDELAREFNLFLKEKGLDSKYSVEISNEEE